MALNPKVKTTDWHYKFWQNSYRILWLDPPERFSICPYFWRVALFAPFLLYPAGALLRIVALPFKGLAWLWRQLPQRPYKRKPYKPPLSVRHPKLAAARDLIGNIFLGLAACALVGVLVVCAIQSPHQLILDLLELVAFIVAVVLLALLVGLLKKGFRSESARLLGQFMKAKKAKLCPFVEVVRA